MMSIRCESHVSYSTGMQDSCAVMSVSYRLIMCWEWRGREKSDCSFPLKGKSKANNKKSLVSQNVKQRSVRIYGNRQNCTNGQVSPPHDEVLMVERPPPSLCVGDMTEETRPLLCALEESSHVFHIL
ncbi:hypothetical protein GDO78_022066 [Eleutherodactylus coqui]|uniref:Uncharacterized protein n=1 Tax=Eleutherodactylus coqui TaxID=57060 RepID=A0A8J6B357_ELECQ|nr:hypothetical protein GDO78_022066 [Eleutherodactylus coqui]